MTYPPCAACECTGNACHGVGYPAGTKLEWPELVGVNEAVAKAKIEQENNNVTVVTLYRGMVGLPDTCCNRVYLLVDHPSGVVLQVPKVG